MNTNDLQKKLGGAMAKIDAGIFDITLLLDAHKDSLSESEAADMLSKKDRAM